MLVVLISAGVFISTQTLMHGKTNDWAFSGPGIGQRIANSVKTAGTFNSISSESMAMDSSLGFAVGGAKDINNFRENIRNGFMPVATDITHEGLFYDYYFDTEQPQECNDLFCPTYSYAVSDDPLSGDTEHYLSVGLNSNLKESDFQRKKLNLVVVLDISGSMSSQFNRYYYDGVPSDNEGLSKMEVAKKSIVGLLDHLETDDRFGMVLFDSTAELAKPLRDVESTDMDSIRKHIMELQPRGGTNMAAGMSKATELFDEYLEEDYDEYENRIIFLTDAMPNTGEISKKGLLGMTSSNSDNKVYTTFIGIGVDFNTELVEHITKIRGSNYYSVHSSKEFTERMDDQFEYMVTPLVFDLKLELESDGWEIEKVYGSPEADEATGEIMKVNTLFPSATIDGKTKGGIVLLKLKKTTGGDVTLKAKYETRSGNRESSEASFSFGDGDFENTGIRKGILLSRYVNLMKGWTMDEREAHERPVAPIIDYTDGIIDVPDRGLGKWERQSIPLKISGHYESIFEDFADYFENEMDEIGDEDLQEELDLLRKLS